MRLVVHTPILKHLPRAAVLAISHLPRTIRYMHTSIDRESKDVAGVKHQVKSTKSNKPHRHRQAFCYNLTTMYIILVLLTKHQYTPCCVL